MRLNTDGHDRMTRAVALERLARQFREDAHASESAALEKPAKAGENRLRLNLPMDFAVTYEERRPACARRNERGQACSARGLCVSPPVVSAIRASRRGETRADRTSRNPDGAPDSTEFARPIEIVAVQGKDRIGRITQKEAKK